MFIVTWLVMSRVAVSDRDSWDSESLRPILVGLELGERDVPSDFYS